MENVLEDPILRDLDEVPEGDVSAVECVFTQCLAANTTLVSEK